MKLRQILALGLASACLPFAASAAAVCRVNTTEFETLKAGFDFITDNNTWATKLDILADVTITNCLSLPQSYYHPITINGNNHFIKQGYAGRLFSTRDYRANITFKDIVVCGGGDEYSTGDQVYPSTRGHGLFVWGTTGGAGDSSVITLGSGCVISNFVGYGHLLGQNNGGWTLKVDAGSRVVYNRMCGTTMAINGKSYGSSLLMNCGSARLLITGGEIAYNTCNREYLSDSRASNGYVEISGGDIHDNDTTVGGVWYGNNSGQTFKMSGGAIHDNKGYVFSFTSGAQKIILEGGMIYGNAGGIAVENYAAMVRNVKVSGDAVVAGNGSSETHAGAGIYLKYVCNYLPPIVLMSDFTGYIQLSQSNSSSTFNVGGLCGTNLNNYAGAENFHQTGNMNRVLVTEEATGRMLWTDTKKAKIGDTEYATLAAALAAAADGAKIELTADACVTATLVPPADKAITVDGKGYRIFRCGSFPLFTLSAANASLTVSNVVVRGGRSTSYGAHKSGDIAGEIVQATGAGSRLAFGPGVAFSDAAGANGLIAVASGSTVAFEGAVVTNLANKVVVAETGSTVELKGATEIRGNDQDLDVPDGNVFKLTGDLAGQVHVTIAGVEPCKGQTFGAATGNWSGLGNFVKPADAPKTLHVEICDGWLRWRKYGFVWSIR